MLRKVKEKYDNMRTSFIKVNQDRFCVGCLAWKEFDGIEKLKENERLFKKAKLKKDKTQKYAKAMGKIITDKFLAWIKARTD